MPNDESCIPYNILHIHYITYQRPKHCDDDDQVGDKDQEASRDQTFDGSHYDGKIYILYVCVLTNKCLKV